MKILDVTTIRTQIANELVDNFKEEFVAQSKAMFNESLEITVYKNLFGQEFVDAMKEENDTLTKLFMARLDSFRHKVYKVVCDHITDQDIEDMRRHLVNPDLQRKLTEDLPEAIGNLCSAEIDVIDEERKRAS